MTAITCRCKICEKSFSYEKQGGGRLRQFCSDACWGENHRREGARWNRLNPEVRRVHSAAANIRNAAANRIRIAKVVGWTKCFNCSVVFAITIGHPEKICCGRECGKAYSDKARSAAATARKTRQCERCGAGFLPHKPGSKSRLTGAVQRFCSRECHAGAPAPSRRRAPRQRNMQCQAVEAVNPIAVLSRDGWRCQLCGISTPRRLRGTFDPRAPEMDHIIPLAQGGEHSYRNTQCACRSCNLKKGARAAGQMRLF